jgi:hypothetical protein
MEERVAMEDITADRWITRQELADRYGVPVKTPAEWASKGMGPPYAKFGRHVRYRVSDVVTWETTQLNRPKRNSA